MRVDRGTNVVFISESVSAHSIRFQRQCQDGSQTVKAWPVSKRKWGSADTPREGGLHRQRRQTSENNRWRTSLMGRGSERSGRDTEGSPQKGWVGFLRQVAYRKFLLLHKVFHLLKELVAAMGRGGGRGGAWCHRGSHCSYNIHERWQPRHRPGWVGLRCGSLITNLVVTYRWSESPLIQDCQESHLLRFHTVPGPFYGAWALGHNSSLVLWILYYSVISLLLIFSFHMVAPQSTTW